MRKSFGELKEEEKGKNFDKNVNSLTRYKIGSTTGPEGGPRTRTASTRIRTAAPFFVNRKFKSHPRGSASAVPLCSTGQSAYLLFLFTFFVCQHNSELRSNKAKNCEDLNYRVTWFRELIQFVQWTQCYYFCAVCWCLSK
jgi:hypothetical protein